jgi:peroxiredoxin
MGFERISAPLDKNGTFSKTIPLTHLLDFGIIINDNPIRAFAVPGDTLELFWDAKDFDKKFRFTAQNPWRTKELELVRELDKKYLKAYFEVEEVLYTKNISDSAKYERVKKLFEAQVQNALTYPVTKNSTKIFYDIYFRFLKSFDQARLLSKYDLSFKDVLSAKVVDSIKASNSLFRSDTSKEKVLANAYVKGMSNGTRNVQMLGLLNIDRTILDESKFYLSSAYRDFIFDHVRLWRQKPFAGYMVLGPHEQEDNFTLDDCYLGAAFLNDVSVIKDWYLAKAIMFGFGSYSFKGSDEAYKQFFPQIQTPIFRDTLQHFYQNIQRLRPGNAAPAFKLKDANGKDVSLSDLKGKVVYIDFWGVYCGPCIYDIKNYATKLHEKYKEKDVVFVNICVDVDPKEWKENIMKLNLDGINLLAEGWTEHPVCKAYNVNAIPHYVIIDQEGKIVDNNADGPGELLGRENNQIDKLLK